MDQITNGAGPASAPTNGDERLAAARGYVASGLSLVPIGENSKWPPWKWKTYQERKPTADELRAWLNKYPGLGIVGGKVSGKDGAALEILDLESIAPLNEFRNLVEEAAPGLLERLPRTKTPTGGRHIFYRCQRVEGNQKLAQRAEEVTEGDLPRTDDGAIDKEAIKKLGLREIGGKHFKIRTLIETRGEGGQVLSPLCLPGTHPSGGVYQLINGDPLEIPTITTRERDILLTAARACNEFFDPAKAKGRREAAREKVKGLKPGADYNARTDIFEKSRTLLEAHGWTVFRTDNLGELLARPGVDDHCSARLFTDGALYVFSTNATPFDAGATYKPFAIFTELKHDGDYSAAAKALATEGYGDNRQAKCETADKKAEGSAEGKMMAEDSGDDAGATRMSKAAMAVELAAGAELFHNAEGRTFARVTVNCHLETWPLKSSSFKRWLGARFWQEHKATIHPPAIAEALQTLDGRALYEGEQREVNIRIAEHEGNIYLDLCDQSWRAIEITPDAWRVISAEDCPVRFRRANGMLALPEPVRGSKIGDLRALMNLADDSQWTLALSWLVAALRPGAPFPILGVHGEHGSAKSTTQKMLRRLVDPNTAPLRSMPRDERDLAIMATNSHILALDNLSHLSESMSDALCRLATGGGLSTRELYSNDDEVIFDLRKPVMLNGITEIATKSDLLDRSILIYLPRIEQSKRLPEKKFWTKFDELQPGILGALLDAAAVALRELPNTDLATLPRMADFALWATAAETGFGLNAGAFMCAYDCNQAEAHQVALEASPLAVELRDWFEGQEYWEGSPTALLGELNKRLEDHKENPKTKQGWPQSSRGLTMRLKVLGPDLRAIGVDAVYERIRGKSFVKIGKISASSASSAQVQPDKELTNSQQDALDALDADDLHRSDDALDALDADGVFSGNGVSDSSGKTFAGDAVDAHKNTTFTTDDPTITPQGWAAPF